MKVKECLMNRPLIIIFITVMLDALGIGLILPILPPLLKDVTSTGNIALYMGTLTALYAVMQFFFAPILGTVSDHIGRRPVLLLALAGSAINYLFLVFSPNLYLLVLGRIIAGIAGASVSVASAYVTDISSEDVRTQRFGLFNAMFGAGFIIGPILGGVLSDYWLRLPFVVAAILNGCNFLMALFILPESHIPSYKKVNLAKLNPFRPLCTLLSTKEFIPVVFAYFIFSVTGKAYGICWVLWGYDAFQWDGFWVGLSLGTLAICKLLVQIFLSGPAVKFLGKWGTVFTGIICACIALVGMAFSREGWMVFVIIPVVALGSIGIPSLQTLTIHNVNSEHRGQIQGGLISVMSLASIISPFFFSAIYYEFQKTWPGAIWLAVAIIYVIALPILVKFQVTRSST